MLFIKEILNRRIPHILGSYLAAATSLVLFIDWLAARYEFPEYYTTIALFGIITIIPSVFILAYFHGAPGKDQWTRIEKIGIPINILFIGFIIFIGNRYEFWLNDNVENMMERGFFYILAYKKLDRIIATTSKMYDEFKKYPKFFSKGYFIPNGVNTKYFTSTNEEEKIVLRKSLDIHTENRIILLMDILIKVSLSSHMFKLAK